ncbi:DeoR/GlpR family DNA-binding transcription regulator [Pseudarthrobacter sp. SL88]|nr:DeoR/GlpR family DNA-binding transcription regulator [Pseudarthrobacter sp. SL88]
MLVAERRSRIMSEVRRLGTVSLTGLAEVLGVSEMTVRRDIESLATEGLIEKVRGGATMPRAANERTDITFATQARNMTAEKRSIAKRAAALVVPGMAVGLAGGSTLWALAQELRGIPELTIVTNSIPVADVFARPDRADEPYTQTVVLTGGVRTPSDAMVGPVAVRSLGSLHCDLVFIGVSGVDIQAGLTTVNLLEAETNRAFVAAGRETTVLADSSKWGAVGLTTIAELHEVDRLIMDDGIDETAQRTLRAHVRELWIVEQDEAGARGEALDDVAGRAG